MSRFNSMQSLSSDVIVACWQRDHTVRPSFTEIKRSLTEMQCSEFSHTPHETFRSIQHSWKQEVQRRFQELKKIESVSVSTFLKACTCMLYVCSLLPVTNCTNSRGVNLCYVSGYPTFQLFTYYCMLVSKSTRPRPSKHGGLSLDPMASCAQQDITC